MSKKQSRKQTASFRRLSLVRAGLVAVPATFSLAIRNAQATTYTWLKNGSDGFALGSNWNPSGPPGLSGITANSDVAVIGSGNSTGSSEIYWNSGGNQLSTGNWSIGALIDVESSSNNDASDTLTNNNTAADGSTVETVWFNGATVSSVSNVILANIPTSKATTLTLDNSGNNHWVIGLNTGNNTVLLGSGDAMTIAVNITQASGVTANLTLDGLSSSSTLTLGGTISYSGTTLISGGTLALSGSGLLPATTALTLANVSGAEFQLNGASQTIAELSGGGSTGGQVSLNSSATLTVGDGNNTTYAGTLTGSNGSLVKIGSGTLTLTGADSYGGTTTLSGGTLLVDASGGGNLNGTTTPTFAGGTLSFKGKGSSTTSMTLGALSINAGGGQLLVNPNGKATTIALGSITGNTLGGTLLVGEAANAGAGTVTITTSTEDNTSTFIEDGGRIVYTTDGGTTVDWATSSMSGAPYTLSGFNSYAPWVSSGGSNSSNYYFSGNSSVTANETIGTLKVQAPSASQSLSLGAKQLTLNGGGLLITGTNAFTISGNGSTGVTAGSSGTGPNDDLIVQQYNTGGLTISAVIGNNGSSAVALTKAGPGTLTLSGLNVYTGGTYINGGTVLANSGNSTGSGAVTIASGGVLAGTGTVKGTVTVSGTITGGAGAANGNATGTLSTGAQTWGNGGQYAFKLTNAGATGTTPQAGGNSTTWDQLSMSALTIANGSTFTIAPVGTLTGVTASTYTWEIAQIGTGTSGNNITVTSGPNISPSTSGTGPNLLTALPASETGLFALNTSGLTVDSGGAPTGSSQFSLYYEQVNNSGTNSDDLVLSYNAAPEPGTAALFLAAGVPVFLGRRRRRTIRRANPR